MAAGADWTITDLREMPSLADTVADRVWRAFWQEDGVALAALRARVDESLAGAHVPTTFVAQRNGGFLGTVGLIASDLDQRPAYTPWVAALWVEPEQRGRGIGEALVARAAQAAFAAGHARVYLCAAPDKARFYERLGWALIERDVGGLDVYARPRPVTAG